MHGLRLADDALPSSSSMRNSLSRWPSSILSTGTPVQRETTPAMWSGVTASSTRSPPGRRSVLPDFGLAQLLFEARDHP
jgi:hypothetical protein